VTVEPSSFLLLLGLGTWSALDGTSVGQFLISRPLVSGALAGLVMGDPTLGLMVGGILEAVHLVDFPVGAVRLPEPGPAAVPGTAAAWILGGAGGLAMGVLLALVLARLGGASVIRLRQLNERILEPLLDGPAAPEAVARRHWICIGADLGRGAALTAVGLGVVLLLPPALAAAWPLAMGTTVLTLAAPAALPLGAMVRRWTRGAPARGLLVAGLVGGAVLGLLLGG
jgi:mannose PTS system EIIC component